MIRLAVRVRREHADLVLAELLELAPAGVEEVAERAGVVEFAVYGAPGELPSLPDLRAAAGRALVEISTSEIADDWSERWRTFHQPILIEPPAGSQAHVSPLGIRPPWIAAEEAWGSDGVREIVIDPGQAFGTGSHATTRLCLELLLELVADDRARGPVLDIGTGSGVLAMAAAMLGFAPVVALDHERESVAAARANAAANHVELDVRRLDIRSAPLAFPTPSAASDASAAGAAGTSGSASAAGAAGGVVVLANLLAPLLEGLSGALPSAPAHLIAGGLLHDQVDDVARAFAQRAGLREYARRQRGEWSALWLVPA